MWPKQIMRADENRLLLVVQFCNHHGLVLSMHEMPSWLSLFVLCSVESLGCRSRCPDGNDTTYVTMVLYVKIPPDFLLPPVKSNKYDSGSGGEDYHQI